MNEREIDSFEFIEIEKDPSITEEMDADPFFLDRDEEVTVAIYPTWFGVDITRKDKP